MTKHDLKELAAIGAELGAAKAENERLRGLLEELHPYVRGCSSELWDRYHAALSQQLEPTDTYTAVDMATAAAQAFRDGQAAVEQAAAQGEQKVAAVIGFYEGEREPRLLSWNVLPNGEHRLYTRPAQTEQQATVKECLTVQPVAYAVFAENGNVACFSTRRDHPSLVAFESDGKEVVSLAPIAQTAQRGEA